MSQDADLLFNPSESLIMSDFSELTEFDDFQKDLFLGNTMEGIPEETLLEDYDCKDDLKLITEDNEVFEASMKVTEDDFKDSMKAKDSPFALFVDRGSSGSLQLMSMGSQLDLPTVHADLAMKSAGLPNPVSSSSVEVTVQSHLPSYTALIAANQLNCLSVDELEQLTAVDAMNTMCVFPSPLSFKQGGSLATGTEELHLVLTPPFSPPKHGVVGASMFKSDAQTQCSDETATSPIQIKALGRSVSDVSSLPNILWKSDDECNVPKPKSAPTQPLSDHSKQNGIVCGIFREPVSDVHSLQRSQSSNSLGHLSMPCCSGVCMDDMQRQPVCKQEVPLLASAAGMSFFSLVPHQASISQGLTPMRRVYSTGDLPVFTGMQSTYGIQAEVSSGMRIGRYTMAERRMKLHRYRQKRTERNFSKKIKYACRKTLADNRPRVRGRFARSDEMGDSGLKGTDLPLIDEYEAYTSHRLCPQVARDQRAYLVVNNSCVTSSTAIAQFWTSVGMKVAM